ncbi:hypothetical protein ACWGRV_22035 [Streptomyces sp. NPDC055663]
MTALAPDGTTLTDTRPRLVPPRSKRIPDTAVDPELAAEEIRMALDGKTVVVWSNGVLTDLSTGLRDLKIPWPVPTGYGRRHDLFQMALAWRGGIGSSRFRVRDGSQSGVRAWALWDGPVRVASTRC